mgnify:CR=1 FL=1
MKRTAILPFFIFSLLLLAVAVPLSVSLGAVKLPLADTVKALLALAGGRSVPGDPAMVIIYLRLLRTALAGIVGASLAVAGAVFQGLFRNPLADPFVIGSSSGAAFGAVVAITLGWTVSVPGFSAVAGMAFLGGIGATVMVYLVTGVFGSRGDTVTLLLAGTAMSSLFSALISILLAIQDKQLHRAYFWLLGRFSGKTAPALVSLLAPSLLAFIAAIASARILDLFSAGDEAVITLGLDPRRARLFIGAAMALSVSASVSVAGSIGFIGLVAPHLARRFVGPVHRRLIPASAVIGALMLILADLVSRTVAPPVELPVGAVTALIGAPYFLWKISRQGLRSL